jgi:hypothetical protein
VRSRDTRGVGQRGPAPSHGGAPAPAQARGALRPRQPVHGHPLQRPGRQTRGTSKHEPVWQLLRQRPCRIVLEPFQGRTTRRRQFSRTGRGQARNQPPYRLLQRRAVAFFAQLPRSQPLRKLSANNVPTLSGLARPTQKTIVEALRISLAPAKIGHTPAGRSVDGTKKIVGSPQTVNTSNRRSPGRPRFLAGSGRLVPGFFRISNCSSCSATLIRGWRARIYKSVCCEACSNSALRCCKASPVCAFAS